MYVYDPGKKVKNDFEKKPQIPLYFFYLSTIQSPPPNKESNV